MAGINYGRVALGGLAAGGVANACDFVISTFLMAGDLQRMTRRLNLDWEVVNGPGVLVTWTIVDFLYATLMVWTYAAIRPRFGPGPKTAILAGLVIFAAATVVLFGFQSMGIFTMDSFIKNALFSLGTAVLASLAGGAIYKEDESKESP
jgi:hypothetical protein